MEHSKSSAFLLLPVLSLCGVAKSHAAWEIVPELSITAETDDNLRLLPDEAPDLGNSGATLLDAQVTMSSTGARGSLIFEPRVRSQSYSSSEDENFDTTDGFVYLRGAHRWEQSELGFRADYDQQTVRNSEITEATPDDPDVDDPVDPDTGRFLFVDQDRERLLLTPYADFRISERSSVLLEAQLMDVTYSEALLTGRVDFTNQRFAAGIVRNVDERTEVSARLVTSRYEADFNENKTDTVGVEGSFTRPLVRGWQFELNTGVSRSDFTFLEDGQRVDNADTSFIYGVRFRQRTERNTINIDVLQETNPNSAGFLYIRDEIRVYTLRSMTERLTGTIGLRAYSTRTLDDFAQDDQRDYARLELQMEWAFAERLFLAGGYAFTSQKFLSETDSPVDASSNAIFLGITYRGLSRQ